MGITPLNNMCCRRERFTESVKCFVVHSDFSLVYKFSGIKGIAEMPI
jgi:hypothetical protein